MQRIFCLAFVLLLAAWSASSTAAEPIKEFQVLLADRGCPVGTPDGVWGPRTTAAAEAISAASGVAINRPVTPELLAALADSRAKCPRLATLERFIPGDVLGAVAALPEEAKARACQGYMGDRFALVALQPADRVEGFSSQMLDTQDVGRLIDSFASGTVELATAAFVRGDEPQKELLISILARWADAGAFTQTADCSDMSCREWTSKRGTEASAMKDYQAVQERIIPLALAYYLTLRDFKPAELAAQHASIEKWFSFFFKRMPRNAMPIRGEIFFGFGLRWQTWGSPLIDLIQGREADFEARLANVARRLDELVLSDGSLKERTVRGSRAIWYHFSSLNELFFALEMQRANGVDLYPDFAERLENAVGIFLDSQEDLAAGRNTESDPARIYQWAKVDFHSASDPHVQVFGPSEGNGLGDWGGWMYVYLYRFPDGRNAERMRALVAGYDHLPQRDQSTGLNTGCLYRTAMPDLLAREVSEGLPIAEEATIDLLASLNAPPVNVLGMTGTLSQLRQSGSNPTFGGYSVVLSDVAIGDADVGSLRFDVFTDYGKPGRNPKDLDLVRLAIREYALETRADFSGCGELAANDGLIKLHYGKPEEDLNQCIFALLSAKDSEIWRAVFATFPALVAKDATDGNAAAEELEALLKLKVTD